MSPLEDPADAAHEWSAARGLALVLGPNLTLFLFGALMVFSGYELGDLAAFCLGTYPLLSLGWNVMLCRWVRRKGGVRALRGAVTGTALVFLACSSCWVYAIVYVVPNLHD